MRVAAPEERICVVVRIETAIAVYVGLSVVCGGVIALCHGEGKARVLHEGVFLLVHVVAFVVELHMNHGYLSRQCLPDRLKRDVLVPGIGDSVKRAICLDVVGVARCGVEPANQLVAGLGNLACRQRREGVVVIRRAINVLCRGGAIGDLATQALIGDGVLIDHVEELQDQCIGMRGSIAEVTQDAAVGKRCVEQRCRVALCEVFGEVRIVAEAEDAAVSVEVLPAFFCACCCSCDPVVVRIEHSVQDIDTVGIERCIDTDIRTSGAGVLMRVIELRLLIEACVVHIDGVALYVEGGAIRDRLQVDVENSLIDACCRCVGTEGVQDAISRAERVSWVKVDLVASCDSDSLQPLNDGCVVIGVSLVRSERVHVVQVVARGARAGVFRQLLGNAVALEHVDDDLVFGLSRHPDSVERGLFVGHLEVVRACQEDASCVSSDPLACCITAQVATIVERIGNSGRKTTGSHFVSRNDIPTIQSVTRANAGHGVRQGNELASLVDVGRGVSATPPSTIVVGAIVGLGAQLEVELLTLCQVVEIQAHGAIGQDGTGELLARVAAEDVALDVETRSNRVVRVVDERIAAAGGFIDEGAGLAGVGDHIGVAVLVHHVGDGCAIALHQVVIDLVFGVLVRHIDQNDLGFARCLAGDLCDHALGDHEVCVVHTTHRSICRIIICFRAEEMVARDARDGPSVHSAGLVVVDRQRAIALDHVDRRGGRGVGRIDEGDRVARIAVQTDGVVLGCGGAAFDLPTIDGEDNVLRTPDRVEGHAALRHLEACASRDVDARAIGRGAVSSKPLCPRVGVVAHHVGEDGVVRTRVPTHQLITRADCRGGVRGTDGLANAIVARDVRSAGGPCTLIVVARAFNAQQELQRQLVCQIVEEEFRAASAQRCTLDVLCERGLVARARNRTVGVREEDEAVEAVVQILGLAIVEPVDLTILHRTADSHIGVVLILQTDVGRLDLGVGLALANFDERFVSVAVAIDEPVMHLVFSGEVCHIVDLEDGRIGRIALDNETQELIVAQSRIHAEVVATEVVFTAAIAEGAVGDELVDGLQVGLIGRTQVDGVARCIAQAVQAAGVCQRLTAAHYLVVLDLEVGLLSHPNGVEERFRVVRVGRSRNREERANCVELRIGLEHVVVERDGVVAHIVDIVIGLVPAHQLIARTRCRSSAWQVDHTARDHVDRSGLDERIARTSVALHPGSIRCGAVQDERELVRVRREVQTDDGGAIAIDELVRVGRVREVVDGERARRVDIAIRDEQARVSIVGEEGRDDGVAIGIDEGVTLPSDAIGFLLGVGLGIRTSKTFVLDAHSIAVRIGNTRCHTFTGNLPEFNGVRNVFRNVIQLEERGAIRSQRSNGGDLVVLDTVPQLAEAFVVRIALHVRVEVVERCRDLVDHIGRDGAFRLALLRGGDRRCILDLVDLHDVAVLIDLCNHTIVLDQEGGLSRCPHRIEELVGICGDRVVQIEEHTCERIAQERLQGFERTVRVVDPRIGDGGVDQIVVGGPTDQLVARTREVRVLRDVDGLTRGVGVRRRRAERIGAADPHALLRNEGNVTRSRSVEQPEHEHVVRISYDSAGIG